MSSASRGLLIIGFLIVSGWTEPNWRAGAPVPPEGRANPYLIEASEYPSVLRAGRLHALHYPVSVTGLVVPEKPIQQFFEAPDSNPLRVLLKNLFQGIYAIRSLDDLQNWMGLKPYPDHDTAEIPFLEGERPSSRMGWTRLQHGSVEAFTVSCAQCHSSQLFGVSILGMSNRFPRANEVFVKGKEAMSLVTENRLRWLLGATDEEVELFLSAKDRLKFVGAKQPDQLGLDTSLAQVALSLARRSSDEVATLDPQVARRPRKELLANFVADSKPAVWWNLKYKNRWLSDGSVVSGNPILTNFLWNEIGRGTDLVELESWLTDNSHVVRELTTAVFATEPPQFFDFFDAEKFDFESAQRGEKLFEARCARCHGVYEKGWSLPHATSLSRREQLATTRVRYHPTTPVVDVGTDPQRAMGMKSLEQLNRLRVSQSHGIEVKAQKGYVPPPLVGIWARWPYFHNNSVPTLCDVLKPADQRPRGFWMGEPEDPDVDFDSECNGYPKRAPRHWSRSAEFYFSTKRPGSSHKGHDKGILTNAEGKSYFNHQDRIDLVRFLQTL